MSRRIKSLKKIFLRLQRWLDHLQCNVKRTHWSDYVSRVDLSLSFLSSRKKKRQKQKTMVTLPMCWSFFIIWQSCTHSSERLKMRFESLRNVAMHFKVFKCVKNAFHSSAVSHTPTFWAKDVWCYDAYFVTNCVKEDCDAAREGQNGPGGSVHLGHSFTLFI